ncbi:hypothetical protein EW146_g9297 [Bondarzewia mesenterica]|uniref:Oxidoreductase-like domain-containing protein n=1 Tax=Bondarzewia mesenterica TaxID=1095465 RepID=A0A4S4L7G5_9AGAM|nr:hypothetical protein EW146_g9297 [Bondarzewia mesenterica]
MHVGTVTLSDNQCASTSSYQSPSPIERLKRPIRGGQNLSERFCRLEKSLREKGALSHALRQSGERTLTPLPVDLLPSPGSPAASETFMGLVIPQEPKPPESDECCMSGCAICVYDLYQESMESYMKSLDKFCASLISMHIPESQWPVHTRKDWTSPAVEPYRSVSLNAFKAMELALEEKRDRVAEVESRS